MLTEVIDGVYLGDLGDAKDDEQLSRRGIERVVSLTAPEQDSTTAYHPLTDGKNDQEEFDAAVDAAKEAIEAASDADEGVLVHCMVGRSRSPSILATALADLYDETFDDAMGRIHDTDRYVQPARPLVEHAREYLGEPSYAERRRDARDE